MNNKKIKEVLQQETGLLKPTKEEIRKINNQAEELINKLEKQINKQKIKADVFIGGSLAKGTLVKKEKYDIDIFVRFDKGYEDSEISGILGGLLKGIKVKAKRIHGSRDYFQLRKGKLIYEIIPVARIKKLDEARNVTDLSYFHVNYVKQKINKNKKLADEIILAKSFCYFQKCYGAESYIGGFSGYALELLVSYYGSFIKFIKEIQRKKPEEKIIIDPAKHYKNKDEIMLELNESKLQSPIVFVDPTFKARNAVAALSKETFEKFKIAGKKFLSKPSKKFFELQKIQESRFNLILEASTSKQEGDIAGSKLLKFSRFFSSKIEGYFKIKEKDFEYSGKRARYYFRVERKKEIIFKGPPINKVERLMSFKLKHKNVFIKNYKAYARGKSISLKEFFCNFLKKNKQVMKDMGIDGLKVMKR